MGYSSKIDNVMLCLNALETVFSDMGKKVDIGSAQTAAHKVYEENTLNAVPVKII